MFYYISCIWLLRCVEPHNTTAVNVSLDLWRSTGVNYFDAISVRYFDSVLLTAFLKSDIFRFVNRKCWFRKRACLGHGSPAGSNHLRPEMVISAAVAQLVGIAAQANVAGSTPASVASSARG